MNKNNNLDDRGSRDLRKYAASTNFRLIVGAFVLLFVVGLGIIGLIYGFKAALFGFLCLLGGMVPIVLILIFWFGLDAFLKKINKD
ncbi:MAG: hypothetical protein VB013_04010 [Anaerolineaceae bacterium]|nr:hypothetical protein [Anaerolineaceae bacterium]